MTVIDDDGALSERIQLFIIYGFFGTDLIGFVSFILVEEDLGHFRLGGKIMAIFTGAGVAIVTPMHENGDVNYEKLSEILEEQIAGGTDAIIICGTSGCDPLYC